MTKNLNHFNSQSIFWTIDALQLFIIFNYLTDIYEILKDKYIYLICLQICNTEKKRCKVFN